MKNKINIQKILRNNKGVTIVALVVTIVIILILAGVGISTISGENGIIKKASEAKEKTEIAGLKERIELVQQDWFIDKTLDPTVTVDDFWDKLIDEGIINGKDDVTGPEKEGDKDIYTLETDDGYKVEVIVDPDGDIEIGDIGKDLEFKIREIEIKEKTENSITVAVNVRSTGTDEVKVSYYYKTEDEDEYHELIGGQDTTDLEATFTGLEEDTTYNIKVVATEGDKTVELVKNISTLAIGKIEETVTAGTALWNETKHTASVELSTTTSYKIQWKKEGATSWNTVSESTTTVSNLDHNDTIVIRLWNGKIAGPETKVKVEDKQAPIVTVSKGTVTSNSIQVSVTSVDNQWGMPTNPTYKYYIKKKADTSYPASPAKTGTETTVTLDGLEQGTAYTIKVTTTDKAGNTGEGKLGETDGTGTEDDLKTGTVEGAGTSNSIQVTVSSSDAQWGMPTNPTYNYYIKKKADANYPSTPAKTGTETSFTFTGLDQGTAYAIKVTTTDKAGNAGEDKIGETGDEIKTGTVTGAGTDLTTGVLTASAPSWNPTSHKASITLTTTTDYQIQWQKDGINGTWTTVDKGTKTTTISGLDHNSKVFARLYDGKNAGKEASVTVKDSGAPTATVTITSTEISKGEKITATVAHVDNQSGVNVSGCKWKFTTSQDELGAEATSYAGEMSGSFTSESENIECTANTEGTYWLHVLTADNGGNPVETVSGTSVVVIKQGPYSASDLANDDNVFKKVSGGVVANYEDGQDIEWKVFYADDKGIYLIASDYVPGSKLTSQKSTLGFTDNGSYNIFWAFLTDFKVTSINSEVASRFMLNQLSQFNTGYDNYKMTACLIDATKWNTFRDARWVDENDIIGSPTLEMYVASWNKKYPSNKLYTATGGSGAGYYVGTSANPTSYSVSMSSSPGYSDTLYYPHTNTWHLCNGYWLASPSAVGQGNELHVEYSGRITVWSTSDIGNLGWVGIRPVVHLKSGVKLKEVEDKYILVTEEAVQLVSTRPVWDASTHKASITLMKTSTDDQIQWQKGGIAEDGWTTVEKGKQSVTIPNLSHNDTIYARLWDGTSVKKEATVKVEDGQEPDATITLTPDAIVDEEKITATVAHVDDQSGVNVASCKWKYTTIRDRLGTEATSYEGDMSGSFTSESEKIECTANTAGTYWLHVLTVDNAGNSVERVSSEPVGVSIKVYYADKDNNGTPDGVIFADLTKGSNGEKQWGGSDGKYTIPKSVTNPKQYTVINEAYSGAFGTGKVLKATGTGEERFYIMSLSDLDSTTHYWYKNATNMSDYSTYTSVNFGTGKENTTKMITKWKADGYGAGDSNDMWSLVQGEVAKGWFVPSKEELVAFANELGINSYNYRRRGHSLWYWSSSQALLRDVWYTTISNEGVYISGCSLKRYVRLCTTF